MVEKQSLAHDYRRRRLERDGVIVFGKVARNGAAMGGGLGGFSSAGVIRKPDKFALTAICSEVVGFDRVLGRYYRTFEFILRHLIAIRAKREFSTVCSVTNKILDPPGLLRSANLCVGLG